MTGGWRAEKAELLESALQQIAELHAKADVLTLERDALIGQMSEQGSHIGVARESARVLRNVLVSSTQFSHSQIQQMQVCAHHRAICSVG
jgi:hypothetical protein